MSVLNSTCQIGNSIINIDDLPHHCKICQKGFEKAYLLSSHMLKHNKIKPFFCNICKRRFYKESMYRIHIRSHTGERPFSCKVCNTTFPRERYAKRHVCIHFYKDRFFCGNCSKGYYYKYFFKRHVRTKHKLLTRHLCRKDEYDEHALTHSIKRLYLCKACRKQFSSLSNLKNHQCIPIKK